MRSTKVFYEGHVQGVGFRYSVRQIAKGFDVVGAVRNLPDGRVELRASGDDAEVSAFLDAIAQSELRCHIRNTSEESLTEPCAERGFEIKT